MSAEVLRQAAALMRSRAEAAFGSPWDGPDDYGVIRAGYGSLEDGELVHGEDCGCGGGIGFAPNAKHIASWHPAVALAVADWLDADADYLDANPGVGAHSLEPGALAVARAYLGSDA